MQSGIIIEISENKATIMKSNGEFVTVKAQSSWKKGEIVTVKNRSLKLKPIYTVAACFALIISLGFGGHSIYFDEISLVSIDVNPSIEISLNRFDRVISTSAHNDEGTEILNSVDIINKKYNEAIEILISNDFLSNYIADDSYITFTVQADDKKKEGIILNNLKMTADTKILSHHQNANVECFAVDQKFVQDAHSQGVTAGKYMALLELQKVIPKLNIDDYSHHSIEEIKNKITEHESNHINKNSNLGKVDTNEDKHYYGEKGSTLNGNDHH